MKAYHRRFLRTLGYHQKSGFRNDTLHNHMCSCNPCKCHLWH
nr:MAG TPA: hypothetical protein [Caudoviricetes sp.]